MVTNIIHLLVNLYFIDSLLNPSAFIPLILLKIMLLKEITNYLHKRESMALIMEYSTMRPIAAASNESETGKRIKLAILENIFLVSELVKQSFFIE